MERWEAREEALKNEDAWAMTIIGGGLGLAALLVLAALLMLAMAIVAARGGVNGKIRQNPAETASQVKSRA